MDILEPGLSKSFISNAVSPEGSWHATCLVKRGDCLGGFSHS